MLTRRTFLATVPAAAASLAFPFPAFAQDKPKIYKSVKWGMIGVKGSVLDKFKLMKDLGYDGIELDSPGGADKKEALKAGRETGMPIHGAVDSIHWRHRLSDPDEAVRKRGLDGLLTALKETKMVGGNSVLLVPGRVANAETENHDHVWKRSIVEIRKALPVASKLGVRILIENVWNGFCYDPKGGADQSAEKLVKYIDEINSPWVGVYFDVGNIQRYGNPAAWIRRLGSRIVKLDMKDWGKKGGFGKIGDGDVDWKEVRKALKEIKFTGWATAEVRGGDRKRLEEIHTRMDLALGL